MGHATHHAIVVSSFDEKLAIKAHRKAYAMFYSVSGILISQVNAEYSFFIPTDGSKDGWAESEAGDKQRKAFMDWCDSQAHEDGSNSLQAVEMFYHDENNKAGIVRHTGIEYT